MPDTEQPPQGTDAPLDLATRLTKDHHQSLKLWLRMLSCTMRIENEIRSRLRATFDITLPRFDLMAQLERHPDGLRMGELSKRMMVTGGNITGITDQLEREQLVLALQAFVREQIAPYKYPRAIIFTSQLPRTETGKLQRFKLRRL